MSALRLIFGAATWVAYLWLFFLGLWPWLPWYISPFMLGLPACAVAVTFMRKEVSYITGLSISNAPRWLWLWGNDEDGYESLEAHKHYKPDWPNWLNRWWWAAIRNPVGNLRFVPGLCPPQRAADVQWVALGNWTIVWQGWRTRLIWNNDNRDKDAAPWFAIGWKYEPEARDATGWQVYGQGFGLRYVRS